VTVWGLESRIAFSGALPATLKESHVLGSTHSYNETEKNKPKKDRKERKEEKKHLS
jgi:hypothetical protein